MEVEQQEYMVSIGKDVEAIKWLFQQVEGLYTLLEPCAVGHVIQLFDIDLNSCIVVTQLNDIITFDGQTGFHIRMSIGHSDQRLLHLILVDTSEVQQDRNVILQGVRIHHPVNIHTALTFIQWIPFALIVRFQDDGLLGILCQGSDFPDCRMLHDVLHQDLDAQAFLNGSRQTHGGQGRQS